ncbi:MAG: hypothetical protein JNK87_28915 [Bryobacterales bacterium]|nr:hypothetical protein [Bryobacterales bacterium]
MTLLRGLFRDWPIKRKLLAVILATTTVAVGLAAAGILWTDSFFYRRLLERDLAALSEIIAENSAAPLAFEDAKAASETLAALRAREHLVGACIYRNDSSVLARYFRSGTRAVCPPRREELAVMPTAGAITISRPITLRGKRLGTLSIEYDLGEVTERRTLYGTTVLAILALSSILAALASARLRDKVAEPVFRLVDTAGAVSRTRDYSIRAERLTGDEMGVLVDAFNDMLSRVQSRDEELQRLLLDREEANRQLLRLNEDLERFAFVASHDLQEPIRMITVYTQLLQKRALLDQTPETAGFVHNIVGGARRMRELVDDLRAYAELGAPNEPDVSIDLNLALEKARDNLALSIRSSGAEIRMADLPQVRAYEGHMVALLQNLIGNAIKYRGPAAPTITVGYREAEELVFSVEDNGIGIAPEFREQVFVPFKRLHGPTIPGSGLGLSICKRVVERYGGRIWVDGAESGGSIFRFALPLEMLVSRSEKKAV